ncbi:DNA gyrase subunit B [Bienertia sinuspersici]
MEEPLLLLLIMLLAIANNLAQGRLVTASLKEEKLVIKRQLELLNKPAIKSFVTKHGDILDCVEINKQLAFDHPLLKNHSIQMKPSFKITKRKGLNDNSSTILTASQLLPKSMRCPKGTVLVKRIQEEDLAMAKYSKLFGVAFLISNSSSKLVYPYNDPPPGVHNELAALVTSTQNTGATAKINLWSPSVTPNQYSDVSFFVGNDNGIVTNTLITGWTVSNPHLYPDNTRLYTFWTRDSGKSTGCYNALCPGFVQTSQTVTLGQTLSPISRHMGPQYFVHLTLQQDVKTKNWWLLYGEEKVGYWPKELFDSLVIGANKAGWGGEIQSPVSESPPGMGAGHFPEENYRRACLMKYLDLFAPQGFPAVKDLNYYLTKPKCYRAMYGKYPVNEEPPEGDWGNFVFVGGPIGCKD